MNDWDKYHNIMLNSVHLFIFIYIFFSTFLFHLHFNRNGNANGIFNQKWEINRQSQVDYIFFLSLLSFRIYLELWHHVIGAQHYSFFLSDTEPVATLAAMTTATTAVTTTTTTTIWSWSSLADRMYNMDSMRYVSSLRLDVSSFARRYFSCFFFLILIQSQCEFPFGNSQTWLKRIIACNENS